MEKGLVLICLFFPPHYQSISIKNSLTLLHWVFDANLNFDPWDFFILISTIVPLGGGSWQVVGTWLLTKANTADDMGFSFSSDITNINRSITYLTKKTACLFFPHVSLVTIDWEYSATSWGYFSYTRWPLKDVTVLLSQTNCKNDAVCCLQCTMFSFPRGPAPSL